MQESGQAPAQTLVQVVLLALPAASPLSIFGPAEIFAEANAQCSPGPFYRVRIVSARKGDETDLFRAPSVTEDFWDDAHIDTLLVAGGLEHPQEGQNANLVNWLIENCMRARRFGGFCSGSVLLAEAGLLHRRRVTTHWSLCEQMAAAHPAVEVVSDSIYVKDGNCYTSAGAAAAIDLALSLVEEDLGADIALTIAKRMVVFLRRSGVQPQLSATLLAQTSQADAIGNLLIWMADNLTEDLSVPKLARKVAMSPRNFARHFSRQTGKTPGRHVSDLRLEAARGQLAKDGLTLEEIARASGFGSAEVLRRLFTKLFGLSPGRYRQQLQDSRHEGISESQPKRDRIASTTHVNLADVRPGEMFVFSNPQERLEAINGESETQPLKPVTTFDKRSRRAQKVSTVSAVAPDRCSTCLS